MVVIHVDGKYRSDITPTSSLPPTILRPVTNHHTKMEQVLEIPKEAADRYAEPDISRSNMDHLLPRKDSVNSLQDLQDFGRKEIHTAKRNTNIRKSLQINTSRAIADTLDDLNINIPATIDQKSIAMQTQTFNVAKSFNFSDESPDRKEKK